MNAQLDMFERLDTLMRRHSSRVHTPASRRTDPESSHAAALHITRTGKRGAQQDQAAAAVRHYPAHTSFELALLTELDRYMLARRASECEAAGRIRRGELRRCSVSGRTALTWWPQ